MAKLKYAGGYLIRQQAAARASKAKAKAKPSLSVHGDWPAWLANMSKTAREAYFAKHPGSKYNAKGKGGSVKTSVKTKASNDNASSQLRMLQASLADRKLAVKNAQAKVAGARTDSSRAKHTKALEQAKRQLKQTKATHDRVKRG